MAPRKRLPTSPPALRRENVETERLNLYIPADLAMALRVRCAETRRSISDGVTDALRVWLERKDKRKR
jgi:plasmid stability protein